MSSITLNASFDKNVSLQINDILYYQDVTGTTNRIGPLTSMSDTTVTCTVDGDVSQLNNGNFLFFAKENEINTSGLLGYYAEIDFTNDSRDYAELFAVNSEIFISSN
tara:strand:- start:92 stop:412 length:321 start_codon:yes stop_codon:yes gene_type:complete